GARWPRATAGAWAWSAHPVGAAASSCACRSRREARTAMPRILIVDDEPEMVRGIQDNLRFEGYDTSAAYDGEEALRRAAADGPDLVLLDVMMPKVSGWDVCRELRRRGIDVPVIMLTARGEADARARGLAL